MIRTEKKENLTDKLFLELLANTQISQKGKEKFSRFEDYFLKKQEAESAYIQKIGFYDFFENQTLDEIKGMCINSVAPNFWNEATLLEILIDTLKRYVDRDETLSEKGRVIHDKYLMLKNHFPFLPQGDALKEFEGLKGQREELSNMRVSGSICPSCLGHNVRSKGKEFQCFDCKKRWRKH